ncbi:MAG: S9 family peptidase [Myxococcales bacterium FL481]|nr:MAG: S9 family peptidase [Myxococcales bacterium FL481]
MRIALALWFSTILSVGCTASPPTPDDPTQTAATAGAAVATAAPASTPSESHARVTYEDIIRSPPPGGGKPRSIHFSPDDRSLTFLQPEDGSTRLALVRLDLESNRRQPLATPPGKGVTEGNLSRAEQLRRERTRNRATGIPRYAWSEAGGRLLVPLSSGVYIQDGLDGELRSLVAVDGGPPILDPRFSPDGEAVAFVRDGELYVVPSQGGEPRAVTSGARGTGKTHGLAEYAAQEEMGRSEGFWWSQDSQQLAFAEVDERHVPVFPIVHQGQASTGPDAVEEHRYPFAGQANAHVRLGVVSAGGGRTRWLEPTAPDDMYLARVAWLHDGRVAVQRQNREQTRLDLVFWEPGSGRTQVVLTERRDSWINLHDHFYPLKPDTAAAPGGFVWGSERGDGFMHLYLYRADGTLVRPLTQGPWKVTDVADVDEESGIVYFLSTQESPLERHLYAVGLDGKGLRRITQRPGTHQVVLDHARERFVDTYSSVEHPPSVTVRSLQDNAELVSVAIPEDPHLQRMQLAPPELVQIQSRDGETLHGAVYRPPGNFGPGPWPIVVSVYGGPHVQRVANRWRLTADLRAQHLRNHGYLVFKLDNRGSKHRGLAFESKIRHDLGNLEVQDQVDGVRWLEAAGWGKPGGAGIYGRSYGGYLSAMALARAPQTFRVGVAAAPVTHWDGYDTHYTERYMGTPASNPTGYRDSSVMHHVAAMTGKLLLVHGLIDENVHFRHTARLINALIAHDKDYELLLFPDARHKSRKPADRIYLERRVFEFFERNLE